MGKSVVFPVGFSHEMRGFLPCFPELITRPLCDQDGRSATITAPSGPAQQRCINASLQVGSGVSMVDDETMGNRWKLGLFMFILGEFMFVLS